MPRAAAYNLSTQRIDELLIVQVQYVFHAEPLTQDALDHYGGSPHAYGVTLSRPREPLYVAVVTSLEVDDHRPSALGAAAWYGNVGAFLYAFLILVESILGVLDQEIRATLVLASRLPLLRFQNLYLSMGARTRLPHSVQEPS